MAVLGTGLPEQAAGERVLAQPGGTAPLTKPINADAFSNAQSWAEIAQTGAKLTDAAGDYAKVEIHQAKVGYLADQDVEIARKRADMRDKYALDPQGFDANWTAYRDGKIGAAEPWAVPHLTRSLGSEGNSAYSAILTETRAKDQKLDAERINSLASLTGNDVIGSAMAGTLGDPDGQIKIGKYRAVLDSAVTSGLMPKEKADLLFDDTMSKAQGEIAARDGVQVYREKGFDAAVEHLKKSILENEDMSLKGESRYKAFNRGLSAIRLAAGQDKEDRAALVEASKDLRARIGSNQPYDDGEVRDTLAALQRTGAAAEFKRLSVDHAVAVATAPYRSGLDLKTFAAAVAGQRSAAMPGSYTPEQQQAIKGQANAASTGLVWGDPASPDFQQAHLTTITLPSGKTVTVNKVAAPAFQGFLGELEGMGYRIDSIGGYNDRKIFGTGIDSQHRFGNAIDINPGRNPVTRNGVVSDLPANVSDIAAKYGLSWGGDWQTKKDAMHFEFAGIAPKGGQSDVDAAIQRTGVKVVRNIGGGSDGNLLEFWPAGEGGTQDHPRPKDIPLGQPGVEIYSDKVRPMDVLGDIASHHLAGTDPAVSGYYDQFKSSLTPTQRDRLREQYNYAKENQGEKRSYADWEKASGLPAYFRGYAFGQWPADFNQAAYTPEQRAMFDEMMGKLVPKGADQERQFSEQGIPYAGAIARRVQQTFVEQSRKAWPEFKRNIDQGKVLDQEDFTAVRYAAALSGDANWQKQVEELAIANGIGTQARALPVSQQQSVVDQARADIGTTVADTLQKSFDRQAKMVKDDPVGFAVERFHATPAPLDFSSPAATAASVNQRVTIARGVSVEQGTPPGNPFRPAETSALAGAIGTGDSKTAGAALDALAGLPDDFLTPALGNAEIKAAVAGAARSSDAGRYSTAMQFLDRLWSRSPESAKALFGEDQIHALMTWQTNLRYMSPEQLAKERERAAIDPQIRERVKKNEAEGRELANKYTFDDVAKQFDTSWWWTPGPLARALGSQPLPPADAMTRDAMMGDFVNLYARRYAETLDKSKAAEQATELMKTKWTASPVNGGRLMLNAPEAIRDKSGNAIYPAVNGSYDWMTEQLQTGIDREMKIDRPAPGAITAGPDGTLVAPTFDRSQPSRPSYQIVSDRRTQAEAQAGQPASYVVVVRDPVTDRDVVLPRRFQFDPAEPQAKARADFDVQRRRVLGDLNALQLYGVGGGL